MQAMGDWRKWRGVGEWFAQGEMGGTAKIRGCHFNGGWSAPWLGYRHRAGKGWAELGLGEAGKREGVCRYMQRCDFEDGRGVSGYGRARSSAGRVVRGKE